MPYLTDTAICLRVVDFSETSQIAAMFTQAHGLVPMIAKGAKRQSKTGLGKMSGPLDLLAAGEVVFMPAKTGAELATLAGWQLADQRNNLRQNLPALNAACIAAEITLAVLHPLDPHPDLFAQLQATLDLASTAERPRAVVAYAKAALTAAGYQPQLEVCVGCGEMVSMEGAYIYLPAAGGVRCRTCSGVNSQKNRRSMEVRGRIAIALGRLASPAELRQNTPERSADAKALGSAMLLLLFQIESLLERELRTRVLLESVFGSGVGIGVIRVR